MPPPSSSFGIVAHWDSRQVKAALAALEPKQWAFAQSLALNRVARSVESAERASVRSVFDRPTPFTLNSLRRQAATKTRLEAKVWFKDPPRLTESEHYLLPQVYGGARRHKRFEQVLQRRGLLPKGRALVPASGAPLDAYGNVSRGLYARIYASLNASPVGANASLRSRRRMGHAQRARGGTFFYGTVKGKRGIWARFYFAFGNAVRPVFLETTSMPSYRKRFAFFEVGERTVERTYQQAFDQAAQETLRTAR